MHWHALLLLPRPEHLSELGEAEDRLWQAKNDAILSSLVPFAASGGCLGGAGFTGATHAFCPRRWTTHVEDIYSSLKLFPMICGGFLAQRGSVKRSLVMNWDLIQFFVFSYQRECLSVIRWRLRNGRISRQTRYQVFRFAVEGI